MKIERYNSTPGIFGTSCTMKRQNVRTLSLVVCTFTYLLIGAAVFDALESQTEAKRWEFLSNMKNNFVQKYNISIEDYRMLEIVVIENKPHKAGPQWKFAGAFYFATVVLAMIGYGHSTPVTIGGKAFCMAYAMVGIPLGLVMFQSIGERLNKFVSVVIRRGKRSLRCKQTEATETNLMVANGLLSSIIITTGAAVFSRYEGWSYFDSFYYCFVTLTTIGFGDYVALQNDQALMNKPGYVALSLVFILFGLAVVAASINLLVLRFMTMNAEDIRREELENQTAASHNLNPFLYDDNDGTNPSGICSANQTDNMVVMEHITYNVGNQPCINEYVVEEYDDDDDDDDDICACNCLGKSCANHNDFLLERHSYLPADIVPGTLHFKSATL